MTFSISLPTTRFFPDPAPHAAGIATPARPRHGLSVPARMACACAAAVISTTLIAAVAWGMTSVDAEPATVVAVLPAGSR